MKKHKTHTHEEITRREEKAFDQFWDQLLEVVQANPDIVPNAIAPDAKEKFRSLLQQSKTQLIEGHQVLVNEIIHQYEAQQLQRGESLAWKDWERQRQRLLPSQTSVYDLENSERVQEELNAGTPIAKLLGFTDDSLVIFYQTALELLHQSRFAEGIKAFSFLAYLRWDVSAFWLGLARCYRNNRQYDEALGAYQMLLTLESQDPSYWIEAVRCCIQKGDYETGEKLLKLAEKGDQSHDDKFTAVIKSAQEELQQIKKQR